MWIFAVVLIGCLYLLWSSIKTLGKVQRRRKVAEDVGNPTPQNVGAHDAASAWFGIILFGSGSVTMLVLLLTGLSS